MKQQIMGWHWHQLDHMQNMCTSLHFLCYDTADKHWDSTQMVKVQDKHDEPWQ